MYMNNRKTDIKDIKSIDTEVMKLILDQSEKHLNNTIDSFDSISRRMEKFIPINVSMITVAVAFLVSTTNLASIAIAIVTMFINVICLAKARAVMKSSMMRGHGLDPKHHYTNEIVCMDKSVNYILDSMIRHYGSKYDYNKQVITHRLRLYQNYEIWFYKNVYWLIIGSAIILLT